MVKNIKTNNRINLQAGNVKKVIDDAHHKVDAWGKLLVRQSGTEPLIRIMAQGDNQSLLDAVITEIATAIHEDDLSNN